MRLPRDHGGSELAILLRHYGYGVTRQTGSHMRLTTTVGGEHHITIPRHGPSPSGDTECYTWRRSTAFGNHSTDADGYTVWGIEKGRLSR
jgi:predicted RNA binding protein YcfA (HicA-like mRNA interferase family)